MSWGAITAAAISGGTSYLMSQDRDDESDVAVPTYQLSPEATQIQEFLKDYGMDILSGDLPEEFGLLGQVTSPEITKYRDLVLDDVTESVSESFARYGKVGSPEEASVLAKAVGEAGTAFDYQNILRAMAGQQALLGTGLSTLEGVVGRELGIASQEGTFDLSLYEMMTGLESQEQALQAQSDEATSQAIGQLGGISTEAIISALSS